MTNLQELPLVVDEPLAERRLSSRLMWGVPLAAGGVLGALLLGIWVVPAFQRLQADHQRLATLDARVRELPMLRAQLNQTILQQEQAITQERRLLGLIAGSGDMKTFMAQVNREAQRYGVKLDELQPVVAVAPTTQPGQPGQPGQGTGAANAPANPSAGGKNGAAAQQPPGATGCGDLANAGFTAQRQSLVASGRYPNLLAFMRALERLSLLVVQCDFALQQPDPQPTTDPKKRPAIPPMEVRFALSLYEKPKPGATPPGAPAPAGPAQPVPAPAQP